MWVVIVGLVVVAALGYLCSRVLKGRTGFEPTSQADLERKANQQAEAGLHETRVQQSQTYGGFSGG